MKLLDRARVERAVQSYDLWLDLRGAAGRRRRELRRELRSNLTEAAAEVGAREAVDRLGSTRAMAVEAHPRLEHRPRWSVGLLAGLLTLAVVVLGEVFSALAWTDGVLAAAPERAVSGSLAFFPGSSLEYVPDVAGFSITLAFGWLAPAAGAVVFLVVARAWRSLPGRRAHPVSPATI